MASNYEENALSDGPTSIHKRNSSFSYRVPTPPRIVIPPPLIAADFQDFSIQTIVPPEDQHIDLSFLNTLDYGNLVHDVNNLDWTYERRREAQAILPFLYLGPMSRAKDKTFLQREGITMMLAVRPKQSALTNAAFAAAKDLGIEMYPVNAPSAQDLIAAFPAATRLMNGHLSRVYETSRSRGDPQLGKILVFCESGNDKSAALVAAYIAEMFSNIDHIKAMQICQSQRFCVNFDDTSKQLLQSYHDILLAKRHVAQSLLQELPLSVDDQQNVTGPRNEMAQAKQKRGLEDTFDEEDAMEVTDVDRFDGRNYSPFT